LQSANIQPADPGTLEKRAFMRQKEIIQRWRENREYIERGEADLRRARKEERELLASLRGTTKKEKKS
jgi:hypothetical protein